MGIHMKGGEIMESHNIYMEEVDAPELNGDGAFIAGAITGGVITAGVAIVVLT